MSLDECRESIEFHDIHMDMSSPMCNNGRIELLRSVLDLFETYSKILEEKEII